MNGYFLLIIFIVVLATVSHKLGLAPVEDGNYTHPAQHGQTAP